MGILQARKLEWVAMPSSSASYPLRDGTHGYCITGRFFTAEPSGKLVCFIHFSHSVVSDSLWLHGMLHTRLPCPSPTPGACSNACPLSRWCHPTISSYHPLLLLHLIFPKIRIFSNESVLHVRWRKYWSFNFSISPSKNIQYSLGMDWLDLLAVQGTLKSLLQHDPQASILWHSAFFIVQLSHP